MRVIKTLLADDQPIFLTGLQVMLKEACPLPIAVVGVYHKSTELLRIMQEEQIDLLIMDLNLEDLDGLELIRQIRKEGSRPLIQVLSRYNQRQMVRSVLQAGANAYVLKNTAPQELFSSLQQIMQGGTYVGQGVDLDNDKSPQEDGLLSFEEKLVQKYYLTQREMQVLQLITQARSNKEIAKELFISDQTVSVHRKNIMRKVGVNNTAGLMRLAYAYGLV